MITLTIDGEQQQVEPGTTGTDWYGKRREVVAMTVDGQAQDLFRELPAGATVTAIELSSPEGLQILRHSAAHVLAQAVQEANPQVDLGIGPRSRTASTTTLGSTPPSRRTCGPLRRPWPGLSKRDKPSSAGW